MKKKKIKKNKVRIGVEAALALRKHFVKESKKKYDRRKINKIIPTDEKLSSVGMIFYLVI